MTDQAPGFDAIVAGQMPNRTARKSVALEALRLRVAGLTYQDVSERVNVPVEDCYRMVHELLSAEHNPAVAEMRMIENSRLDRAQAAVWPKVLNGELRAVDLFVKISQRRAKMNGLDAPVQVAISGDLRTEMEAALHNLEVALAAVEGDIVDAEEVEDDGNPVTRALSAGTDPVT